MIDYGAIKDEVLTDLLKTGDRAAFNEIYQRYWRKMLAVAWNHSKNTMTSKDLVHEVFISLWERRDIISIQSLPAFLSKSVRMAIFKEYQRSQRRNELARLHYHREEFTDDEKKLDAIFLQEYINGIVDKLPEKCRLVFHCSRNLGMKNAEIAAFANISEKGVEANLTRALKIIRKGLDKYGWVLLAVNLYDGDFFK